MKPTFLSILTFLVVTSLSAQMGNNIQLSSNITTLTKDISGFDKIEVSEDFEVYIHFSDSTEKVDIEANENLHELINVEKDGSTLKINTKSYSTIGRSKVKERLVAHITAKQLVEIKGNEDVVIHLKDKLSTKELSIDLDEDSTLSGHIEVQRLKVNLDEDSILDITGSAQSLNLKADEDSVMKGFDFVANDVTAHLNEDSEAKLTINGGIKLRAKEDSYFHFKGDGHFVRKILTGDSEVKSN